MTYPLTFRQKIPEIREREELTIAQIAARFDVGVASVVRWLESPVPKATRKRKPPGSTGSLWPGMRATPRYLSIGRAACFGVSQRGIGQALRRLGATYKQTSSPKASKDGRRAFRARIKAHQAEGRAIFYSDEAVLPTTRRALMGMPQKENDIFAGIPR